MTFLFSRTAAARITTRMAFAMRPCLPITRPIDVYKRQGDGVRGYMVYEDGVFTLKNLDGGLLATLALHG